MLQARAERAWKASSVFSTSTADRYRFTSVWKLTTALAAATHRQVAADCRLRRDGEGGCGGQRAREVARQINLSAPRITVLPVDPVTWNLYVPAELRTSKSWFRT